MEESGLDRLI